MNVSDLKIHHFGVAVLSIEAAAAVYEREGFLRGKTVEDSIQDVKICFMEKPDEVPVELIEPLSENSPVSEMLRKSEDGVEPYHVCYSVKSLDSVLTSLRDEHWIPVQSPVPAVALGNARAAFMYSESGGLVELLEEVERK